MMMGRIRESIVCLMVLSAGASLCGSESPDLVRLVIEPGETVLRGAEDRAQLLVTGFDRDGSCRDLTHAAEWSCGDDSIAAVEPGGSVVFKAKGRTEVMARVGSLEARARIVSHGEARPRPVEFDHDVLPALTKSGCNQGACHGTPTGKNGFRLSLRGYDPVLDLKTLTHEVGARRIDRLVPESSLILLKGSGMVAHQGGQRFTADSLAYRILRDWVKQGARPAPEDGLRLVGLEVTPADRVLDWPAKDQQLSVRARFSDGTVRDVTRLAQYSSSDESVAQATPDGRVIRARRGEVTFLVGFESLITTCHLIFREPVPGLVWNDPPENNFIDHHVFAKLKLLRIAPSDLADDRSFVRRVFLDTIGTLPTPEEVRSFVADARSDKRSRLIHSLLDRPEYVDFWALKWADRLGCNQRFVGLKGAYSYHRWIRDQIAANVPFDRFVRSIVTAKGSNYTQAPASFYRRVRGPEDAAESVSQLFLGIRLQCARCHNHVAERWTQDDYYRFAAFFSQVRYKNGPQTYALYNKEETVFIAPRAQVRHPRTGAVMAPRALLAEDAAIASGEDRREALADWLVAPANPFFARAAVNRIWYHLLGRGIVDPVDDIRDSNPPASSELLNALAEDFVSHGFDVKHTIRTILNSRTYQLSSQTNEFNAEDQRYFSHSRVRLLSAEQLLDAVSRVTEVPERFFHLPTGTRAAQIPDGEFNHPFLRSFGQPPRSVACECERESDSTLEQALQIVGGRTINAKVVAPANRLGRLLQTGASDQAVIDELFLAALGREPDSSERSLALERISKRRGADRRGPLEDLLWTLFNHPEFLFQH